MKQHAGKSVQIHLRSCCMQRRISTAAEVYFPKREKAGEIAGKAIPITRKTAKRVHTNTEKRRKKRSLKGTSYVPEGQQLKIQRMHLVEGMNISQISEETGRNWRTVSKIVSAEKVQQHIAGLREKFYGELDELLLAAIIGAKTQDARLAYKMVCDAGLFPKISPNYKVFNEPTPEEEQSAIRQIAVGLVQGALERHKFFGMEMEGVGDVQQAILAKEKERI
jgi:hypothetical protein